MATIIHTDWLDGMLGNPTHSVVDIDTDNMDVSLLDEADSGTITASFVDYDEVDNVVVVALGDLPAVTSITAGVVTITGALTFSTVTGDEAEFLTLWKDSGSPATSPLVITWDSASSGLAVTPNGGDIISTWGSNIVLTLA